MGFRKVYGGSLYVSGKAVNLQKKYRSFDMGVPDVGMPYQGGDVRIGDTSTEDGARIHWLQPEGMNILVADRPLLCGISWNVLNLDGFGQGTIIIINGKQYRCRLPMVGKDNDGEWGQIVKAMSGDFDSLHADTVSSYAMAPNSISELQKPAMRIGCDSRVPIGNDINPQDVGFRPVLEPLWDKQPILPGHLFKLDGSLFSIGLPSGGFNTLEKGVFNDWDYAMNTLVKSSLASWDFQAAKASSWCQKLFGQVEGKTKAIIRGGDGAYYRNTESTNIRKTSIGFRPLLCPVAKRGLNFEPNQSIFAGIPDGTQLRMYTMCVNGKPVRNGTLYAFRPGDQIKFTDEFFGEEYLVSWIVFNGRAIAKRNLVTKISWEDLKKQGYCK